MVSFHAPSQKLAVGSPTGILVLYDLKTARRWQVHLLIQLMLDSCSSNFFEIFRKLKVVKPKSQPWRFRMMDAH